MFALYAEVSFDLFGKELRFIGICVGDFVIVAQCWIVVLTLGCIIKILRGGRGGGWGGW